MKKLVDVRCYVTPELKKQIKYYALLSDISVNRWLLNLIKENLAATTEQPSLEIELEDILQKLSNSANLPVDERERLKRRKKEIKSIMKGVSKYGNQEE